MEILITLAIPFFIYWYAKICINEIKGYFKNKPEKTQEQIDDEAFEQEWRNATRTKDYSDNINDIY